MKVRVKNGKKGFINGSLQREGTEFTLKSGQKFSDEWMEKVVVKRAQKAKKEEVAEEEK